MQFTSSFGDSNDGKCMQFTSLFGDSNDGKCMQFTSLFGDKQSNLVLKWQFHTIDTCCTLCTKKICNALTFSWCDIFYVTFKLLSSTHVTVDML